MIQTINQKDHAGNPDREHRVATVCGGTAAAVNKAHVEELVQFISGAIGECPGHALRLHAFMPPYDDMAKAPQGYVEFWLESPTEKPMLFAVEFAGKEYLRLGFDELTSTGMQDDALNSDPSEYAAVACFDELWLFACNVAERLKVSKLHMSYGI